MNKDCIELRRTMRVVGSSIDVLEWKNAIDKIVYWSALGECKIVCICNTHSVVTARSDYELADAIEKSDMATPDGAPVAAMLRLQGANGQRRINGPDLMLEVCRELSEKSISVFLYGGAPETLRLLNEFLKVKFPGLDVCGLYSPPFRDLTVEEDDLVVSMINSSGAGLVWVGLGCPKQEKWMNQHRDRVRAVMIGVGAAFDYHAGVIKRAPVWMQNYGLEWFYRLLKEPRRLWRRYFISNTYFFLFSLAQLCRSLWRS